MIVNEQNKEMQIELRDINYILPAYVRLYLFQTRNEDPEKIVFPMFRSIPHPYKAGEVIPIEYVPDTSPVAVAIAEDGSDIPETTPEAEAKADEAEKSYDAMKARIAELEAMVAVGNSTEELDPPPRFDEVYEQGVKNMNEAEELSPARAALAAQEEAAIPEEAEVTSDNANASIAPTPERLAQIRTPDVVLPPGTQSDYGPQRDKGDQRRVAKDLKPDKEIDESKEKPADEIAERKDQPSEES